MNYPSPDENQYCHCKANPMAAFWCQTGHMLECHYPYDCQTAACGHLYKYDFSHEEIAELEAAARARMEADLMPEYKVDGHGNVTAVSIKEMFGRYAQAILKQHGLKALELSFQEAGFERSESDGIVTFIHTDDPEAIVTIRVIEEDGTAKP